MPKFSPVARTEALHRLLGDHAWQERAACREVAAVEPDLFFPDPDQILIVREAQRFCTECPVRKTCLESALESGDREGIWGGLTAAERAPLHGAMDRRLDFSRVNQTIAGRIIHLSPAERREVARIALEEGWSPADLAALLRVSQVYAARLMDQAEGRQPIPEATRSVA